MNSYNHKQIEQKWKSYWRENKTNYTDIKSQKEKFYCLDMFPYPSGQGLHVGHWRGYVLSDVIARTKKLQGFEVLHPMGFDAFGLPAENAAIKEGVHPKIRTEKAIENFIRQFNEMGTIIDWEKTIDTSQPEYYKWTQWLFLQLYNEGLAYQKEAKVNWCPSCQTVLANEQVKDLVCERCGTTVIKKNLKQWFFKITNYAQELLDELENLDWPNSVKILQKNWIGRSEGATIEFNLVNSKDKIEVFTTRLDTIYGATFIAVSPESKILDEFIEDPIIKQKLEDFRKDVNKLSEIDRTDLNKEKTGFDTNLKAINPLTNKQIPIYVADYVLLEYGTGAIMCVPAHDQRDYQFARKYNIEVIKVISDPDSSKSNDSDEIYTGYGKLINSNEYNSLESSSAIQKMCTSKIGNCKQSLNYKLRDWLISRQRYWGAPIPIIHCEKCGAVPLKIKDLPILLPEIDDFKPKGKSPLESSDEFVNTTCPTCGGSAKRETDTMDTFVDSSWYFLRYLSPKLSDSPFDKELADTWLPVDQYIGGIEHATMHLLYSRFITKVLADKKIINFREPFKKLFSIGLIYFQGAKMSKSKGNVINPDELVEFYGTDALRGYEMFIGPNDQFAEWNTDGINGIYRLLIKIYKIILSEFTTNLDESIEKDLDLTIYEFSEALDEFKTNVAISKIMKFFNTIENKKLSKSQAEKILIIISPLFPFIAEELWERIGNIPSIFNSTWPKIKKLEKTIQKIPIQINGKVKLVLESSNFNDKDALENEAISTLIEKNLITNNQIKKIIVIPSKIVNILV